MESNQNINSPGPVEPWHLTALILSKTSVAQGPLRVYAAGVLTLSQSVFSCGLFLKKISLFLPWKWKNADSYYQLYFCDFSGIQLWDGMVDFHRLGTMVTFPMVQYSPVTE